MNVSVSKQLLRIVKAYKWTSPNTKTEKQKDTTMFKMTSRQKACTVLLLMHDRGPKHFPTSGPLDFFHKALTQ